MHNHAQSAFHCRDGWTEFLARPSNVFFDTSYRRRVVYAHSISPVPGYGMETPIEGQPGVREFDRIFDFGFQCAQIFYGYNQHLLLAGVLTT